MGTLYETSTNSHLRTVYKAQRSVLYPKRLLVWPAFEDACEHIALLVGAENGFDDKAVAAAGWCLYGRDLTEEEAAMFMAVGGVQELLTELGEAGKADVAWAWLRAFGFYGQLCLAEE